MALTKYTGQTNIIQSLATKPNQDGGLTDDQVKQKFDQYAEEFTPYVNDILIPEIEEAIFVPGGTVAEVHAARTSGVTSEVFTSVGDRIDNHDSQFNDISINVKSLGADPTGNINCQSIIDQALLLGYSIYFPSGVYLLNNIIITNPDTKITASKNTILKCDSIVNPFIFIQADNVEISDFTADCNNKATTGIRVKSGCKNITIKTHVKNVYAPDFMARGIHICGETDNVIVDGSIIDGVVSVPNGVEGDNMGTARGITISPTTIDASQNPSEGIPNNIVIKNCVVKNILPREDGDGMSVHGWNNQYVNVIIRNNYLTNCAKRGFKIACAGVEIRDNTVNNPYIGALGNNYTDCMFSFISVFGDGCLVEGNKMIGGSVQIGIEVGTSYWATKDIKVKNNIVQIDNTGIKPAYGLIAMIYDTSDVEIIGNNLANSNRGIQARGKIVNALISNNIIKNASEKGILFENFNYVLITGVNIFGNKIFATQNGIQLQQGSFIVIGNDGVTGWDFITFTVASADAIIQGNVYNIYPSLPTAKAFYDGMYITLKQDTTNPTRQYFCRRVANSVSYEWKLVTVA